MCRPSALIPWVLQKDFISYLEDVAIFMHRGLTIIEQAADKEVNLVSSLLR